MLGTLIRKELLANLRTMRLVIALVFTVVLCLLTTLIGSVDFSANADEYKRVVEENRDELSSVTVYRSLVPTLFCRPQPLHILSRGMLEGRGLGS
jgi:ABC-type Na+ efflux pump permease subunit